MPVCFSVLSFIYMQKLLYLCNICVLRYYYERQYIYISYTHETHSAVELVVMLNVCIPTVVVVILILVEF